jgi:hypothetical protein
MINEINLGTCDICGEEIIAERTGRKVTIACECDADSISTARILAREEALDAAIFELSSEASGVDCGVGRRGSRIGIL